MKTTLYILLTILILVIEICTYFAAAELVRSAHKHGFYFGFAFLVVVTFANAEMIVRAIKLIKTY